VPETNTINSTLIVNDDSERRFAFYSHIIPVASLNALEWTDRLFIMRDAELAVSTIPSPPEHHLHLAGRDIVIKFGARAAVKYFGILKFDDSDPLLMVTDGRVEINPTTLVLAGNIKVSLLY
jgi:hypothetical protein